MVTFSIHDNDSSLFATAMGSCKAKVAQVFSVIHQLNEAVFVLSPLNKYVYFSTSAHKG